METAFPKETDEFGRWNQPEGSSHSRGPTKKILMYRCLSSVPYLETPEVWGIPQQHLDWATLSVPNRQWYSAITSALSGKPPCPLEPQTALPHQEASGLGDTATWAACHEKTFCEGRTDFLSHRKTPGKLGREAPFAPFHISRDQWEP